MSDSRRTDKPRQIRIHITAGVQDLEDVEALLRDNLTEGDYTVVISGISLYWCSSS